MGVGVEGVVASSGLLSCPIMSGRLFEVALS